MPDEYCGLSLEWFQDPMYVNVRRFDVGCASAFDHPVMEMIIRPFSREAASVLAH